MKENRKTMRAEKLQQDLQKRLNRVEGQVRGIKKWLNRMSKDLNILWEKR